MFHKGSAATPFLKLEIMEEIRHLINRIAMNENNNALTDREKLEKKETILQTVSKLVNWEIMEANNALRYFEEPEEIDAI